MPRRRKWNKKEKEPLRRYVLEMQKLRRHLDTNRFSEAEFVDLIIDGLDEPNEVTHWLVGVNAIDELKKRFNRYKSRILSRNTATSAVSTRSFTTNRSKPATVQPAKEVAEDRCFNCSKLGHFQSQCLYAKHPLNSCFKCWDIGHTHRTCTNPNLFHSLIRAVPIVSFEDRYYLTQ